MQSSNEIERRFAKRSRAATETTGRTISGYATCFNTPTNIADAFIEVVKPGAFARAIRSKMDCRMLVNHEASQIVGRVSNGTLALSEDAKGLRFRCGPLPSTRASDDLLALLKTRTLTECSFGFICPSGGDRWSKTILAGKTRDLRELVDVDLLDCSVVTFPQYSNTTADVNDDEAEVDPARNRLALAAFASSSAPAELRSRIAAVIKHGPIDAEEADLLRRARMFLTSIL